MIDSKFVHRRKSSVFVDKRNTVNLQDFTFVRTERCAKSTRNPKMFRVYAHSNTLLIASSFMVRKTSRTSRGFHGNDHITSAIFNLSTLGPHRNLYDSNSVRLLHQERQPKDPDRHDGEKERERRRSRARRGGARRTGTIQDGETSSHSRPGAVPRRRSPGAGSWALVQPAPWTQKRWVGVVVTIPPPSVVGTFQVTASSCTGATRTLRASSAPVWGVAGPEPDHRPSTWAMGLVDPSAMTGAREHPPDGGLRAAASCRMRRSGTGSRSVGSPMRSRSATGVRASATTAASPGAPATGAAHALKTLNRTTAPSDSAARWAAAPTSDGLPQRSALG